MKLSEKNIVITGATSGIGRSLVELLQENNRIIAVGRDPIKLKELQGEFPAILIVQADLGKIPEVEKAANIILEKGILIDLLINNAAIQNTPAFIDKDFRHATIAEEITTNFTASSLFISRLLPAMLKAEKRAIILNVNTGLALAPKASSAIYCATKAALRSLSLSLHYQLENTNVKVLEAYLPLVETGMTAGRGSGKISKEKAAQLILSGIENEIRENYIGKVKLLYLINRIAPGLARKIMKKY